MNVTKIISGGQTGVDRAALDVALELGIPCGGWCPKDRLAEDGRIPDKYPLKETTSKMAAVRTEKNVFEADATLVLTIGEPSGGTRQTIECAKEHGKPHLMIDLGVTDTKTVTKVKKWITSNGIATLNVAGPRESQQWGIYEKALKLLQQLAG